MRDASCQLHPRLAADCRVIGRLPAAQLLLHRDAALHWFILVPETDELDLLDLPGPQRDALMHDAGRVSDYLKRTHAYPRVNVGALGLLVPQLHLHVVGRREDDPCWPAPVWGRLDSQARYTETQLARIREDCSEKLGAS